MKKIMSILMAVALVLCAVPLGVSADTVPTEITAIVDFNNNVVKKSTSAELKNLVVSGMTLEVKSADGATSYGTYTVDDSYLAQDSGNVMTNIFKIKVPEWKAGSKYQVVIGNCPVYFDQHKSNVETIQYVDSTYVEDADATPVVEKHSTTGVDEPVKISLTTPKGLYCVCVQDGNGKNAVGANVNLTANGTAQTVLTDKYGMSAFVVPATANLAMIVRVSNAINGFVNNNQYSYKIDNPQGVPTFYSLKMLEKESAQNSVVSVTPSYSYPLNRDLLTCSDISVGFYSNNAVIDSMILNGAGAKSTSRLLASTNYAVKVDASDDYSVSLNQNSVTPTLSRTSNITATATPKMEMKVLKTSGGNQVAYNFSVTNVSASKNYTGTSTAEFSVNCDRVYTVKDNASGKAYTVLVDKAFKCVTIDIGTGKITYDGRFDGKNTSVNGIPKTADNIVPILGGLGVLLLINIGIIAFVVKKHKEGVKRA